MEAASQIKLPSVRSRPATRLSTHTSSSVRSASKRSSGGGTESRGATSYKSSLSVGAPTSSRLPSIRSRSLTGPVEVAAEKVAGNTVKRKRSTKRKPSSRGPTTSLRPPPNMPQQQPSDNNDETSSPPKSSDSRSTGGSKKSFTKDKSRLSSRKQSIRRQSTAGNRENVPPPATPEATTTTTANASSGRRGNRHSSVPSDVAHRPRRDSVNEGMCRRCNRMQRVPDEQQVVDRYYIEKCLGQGNFAVVSRCQDNDDTSTWALKEIDIQQLCGKGFCIENEAELMFKYAHPNVCQLREAFQTPFTFYLVLELAEGGDLFDTIKRDGPMSESRVADIVGDTASALRYLHRHKVVHRDIKPENLLLTSTGRVKLTDFGLACRAQGPLYRVCGTPTYVAPEILSEIGYGREVDMWSLGVIMHILLCGYAPFRSGDRERLFELIKEGALVMQQKHWANVGNDTKRVLLRLLQVESARRMSARQLLASRWMRTSRTITDWTVDADLLQVQTVDKPSSEKLSTSEKASSKKLSKTVDDDVNNNNSTLDVHDDDNNDNLLHKSATGSMIRQRLKTPLPPKSPSRRSMKSSASRADSGCYSVKSTRPGGRDSRSARSIKSFSSERQSRGSSRSSSRRRPGSIHDKSSSSGDSPSPQRDSGHYGEEEGEQLPDEDYLSEKSVSLI